MAKPSYRDYDEHPKRGDDIKLSAFGFSVEASGRVVVTVILVLGIVAGLVTWGILHDQDTSRDHAVLNEAQRLTIETLEVQTCVLTLNEDERKAFRQEGRYCGGALADYRIRRHVKPEGQKQ